MFRAFGALGFLLGLLELGALPARLPLDVGQGDSLQDWRVRLWSLGGGGGGG